MSDKTKTTILIFATMLMTAVTAYQIGFRNGMDEVTRANDQTINALRLSAEYQTAFMQCIDTFGNRNKY